MTNACHVEYKSVLEVVFGDSVVAMVVTILSKVDVVLSVF